MEKVSIVEEASSPCALFLCHHAKNVVELSLADFAITVDVHRLAETLHVLVGYMPNSPQHLEGVRQEVTHLIPFERAAVVLVVASKELVDGMFQLRFGGVCYVHFWKSLLIYTMMPHLGIVDG